VFNKKKKPDDRTDDIRFQEEDHQLLTRRRVKDYNQAKKRNRWLNLAIVVVIILLAITAYAIFYL